MEFKFGDQLLCMDKIIFSESTEAQSGTLMDSSSCGSVSSSEYKFDSQIGSIEDQFSEVQLREHWKAKSDIYSSLTGRESSIVQTELLDCIEGKNTYVQQEMEPLNTFTHAPQQDFSVASVIDTELLQVNGGQFREDRKMADIFDEPSLTVSQPMTVASFTPIKFSENVEDSENERVLLEQTLVLLKHSNDVTEKMIREEYAALEKEEKMVLEEVKKMHERLDVIEEKLEQEVELIANHSNMMNEKLDKALALEAVYAEVATNCAKLMNMFPELDQAARHSTQNIALAEKILHLADKFDKTRFPVDGAVNTSVYKETAEVYSVIAQLAAAMNDIDSNIWGSIFKNSEAAQLIEDTMDHLNRVDRFYNFEVPSLDSREFAAYLDQQTTTNSVRSNITDSCSRSISQLSVDNADTSVAETTPTTELDCNETQVEPYDEVNESMGIENALSRIASQVKTALSSLGSSLSSTAIAPVAPVCAELSSGLLLTKAGTSKTDLKTASPFQSTASLLSEYGHSDSPNQSLYLSNNSHVCTVRSTGSHFMDLNDLMEKQDLTSRASSCDLSFPSFTMLPVWPASDVFTAMSIDSITEQTQYSSSSESVY